MVHPLWVPQRRRRPQGVRSNSGNKSLCLLCLFFLLHACSYLVHISRVGCRSTLCWGFCKIGVDKQACLIPVHNLFSQIYIWASLISFEFDPPLTGRNIRTFSQILWISWSIRKNIRKLWTWFNRCEKVVIFSSTIHPPLVDILILSYFHCVIF
jgi:hypothetical protein